MTRLHNAHARACYLQRSVVPLPTLQAGVSTTHLVMLAVQQEMQCDEIIVTSRRLHVEEKPMDEILY